MLGEANCDVVFVQPEVDLVARFDAQCVAQLFGDDDLPFSTHSMSHTSEYNFSCQMCRAGVGRARQVW